MMKLGYGLPFKGKIYKDFSVNLLTVGGQCLAQEALAALGVSPDDDSPRAQALSDMAYLSQQMQIDGIAREALTVEYLLENLVTEDYWQIVEALFDLKKKRKEDTANHAEQAVQSKGLTA